MGSPDERADLVLDCIVEDREEEVALFRQLAGTHFWNLLFDARGRGNPRPHGIRERLRGRHRQRLWAPSRDWVT